MTSDSLPLVFAWITTSGKGEVPMVSRTVPYPVLSIGGVVQSIKGVVFYLTDGSVNCPYTKDQRNCSH